MNNFKDLKFLICFVAAYSMLWGCVQLILVSLWKVWTYYSPEQLSRFGLFSLFNGISTFVGYLMPKLSL